MPEILLADDHDLVRDTIAAYLGQVEDFTVHTAASLDAALAVLSGDKAIELAILDYEMPGMNGLGGLQRVRDACPECKIALMSGVASPSVARRALDQGVSAYFPKSLPAGEMVSAIRSVLSGERYVPKDFEQAGAPSGAGADLGLTPRELEALRLLCLGHSNKQMAGDLGLKEVTVKFHVTNIMTKLGVSNRTQAALRAKELGLI